MDNFWIGQRMVYSVKIVLAMVACWRDRLYLPKGGQLNPWMVLDEGYRTCDTRKGFLGRPHSLLSQFHSFISFAQPASPYSEQNVYIYIHISNCVETVCELPLLPNNTAVKHFYTNRAVRIVDRIFIIGALTWRWLGEYVTVDRRFNNPLFKQKQ